MMLLSTTAVAQQRYALVLGNSNYKQGKLVCPQNDARDIAQASGKLGYKVFREKTHYTKASEVNLKVPQLCH